MPEVALETPRQGRSVLKLSLGISLALFIAAVIAVLLSGASAEAATYSVTTSGGTSNWTAPALGWLCTPGAPGSTGCGSYPGDPAAPGAAAGDIANVNGFGGGLIVNTNIANAVTVNINNSSTVTINSSGALAVTGSSNVASTGALTISGGALNNGATLTISPNATLNLSAGTLTNNLANGLIVQGNVSPPTGTFNWSGGTLNGSGTVIIQGNTSNAVLNVTGANGPMSLSGVGIGLAGNLVYAAPAANPLSLDDASNIYINGPSGVIDLQTDAPINTNGVSNPLINIQSGGTLKKSAGTGTSIIQVLIGNSGTVSVPSGNLTLNNGGTHTGAFSGAAAGGIGFNGSHTFNAGTTMSGAAGAIHVIGGAATFNTAVTIGGTLINDGTIGFGPSAANTQTLSVAGYTQSATGVLNVKLNGPALGQFDQVAATGPVSLAGTLKATLGYAPADNQTWNIMTDSLVSGDFSTKTLPAYATGMVEEVPSPPSGAAVTLQAVPQTDIAVLKTGPSSILDGQNATYTVKVTNGGPSVSNVTMTDNFIGPATFVSVTPAANCSGTGPVTCTFPSMAVSSTQIVSLVLKGSAIGTITNTATVSSSAQDTNSANDNSTFTTGVNPAADLSISSVSGAPNPVNAAATETWMVNAANGGPDAASSAVINISLSTGTINGATSSNPAFTCTNTPSTAQCTAASFASAATTSITIISQAPNQAGTMTLNANISSTTADPNSGNNSGSASVTVNAIADAGVVKTLSGALVAGQNATYTVTAGNNGPSDAQNVVVSDPTPPGLTFVSNSGACATPYPCSLGTITAGNSVTITTIYSVPASASGTVNNTATVTTSTPDSNSANDMSTATNAIVTKADVAINKTLSGSLIAGQNATYTITVTNNGPSDAQNVSVSDLTPPPLTFVSSSVPCSGGFPCSLGTLTAGATVTILSTYSVPSNASGTVTNTATVTSTTSDSNAGNNSSSSTATIVQNADVSVTKTGPPTANPGTNVTYTINVTNNGPSDAASVQLTDPTPPRLSFVSATGACSSFPCALGNMTPGQVKTVQATYMVLPGPTVTIVNTASASSTTPDSNSSNNSGSASTSTGCPTSAPTNVSPANGFNSAAVNGTLSWSDVGAASYTVYLDVQGPNACSKFFVATSANSVTYSGLQPGTTYQWRVEANTPGCTTKTTACLSFTTTSTSTCPTAPPVLTSPVNNATVTGNVTFIWSAVSGARDYNVFVNGSSIGTTTATTFGPTPVANGPIAWYVVAEFDPPCTSLTSLTGTFNGCDATGKTIPSIVGQADSGQAYDLFWDPVVGATNYEVDEATDVNFANLTTQSTTKTQLRFQHPVKTPTAFYYRVRAFFVCANAFGSNSVTVRVVLAPITAPGNPNVSAPSGSTTLVPIIVHVPGFPDGSFPFSASLDPQQPWLVSVTPSSGSLPPEGIDLTVLANPTGLPAGTHTGTVIVSVTTSASGPIVANGVVPVNAPVSISLVTAIRSEQPGMPPPNALIIMSTGHLDGINSRWASNVAIDNNASQRVTYQLTFTPDDVTKGVKQTLIDINAGATTTLDDIVKTWYGVGSLGESSNGSLEIRPRSSPAKGATADDVSVSLTTTVSSKTFNASPNAAAGALAEYIPGIMFQNFVGRALDSAHAATILGLQQIEQSSDKRTNLGVMEASGQPASVLISVFDGAGKKLLDVPMALAGGQHVQLNSFLAQNKISMTNGHIEVQATSGEGKIMAYASVVDNKSGDPIFVSGVPLGQNASNNFVLLGAADLNTPNAAWRTSMSILNPTTSVQTAQLTLYPLSGGGATQGATLSINPGEVKRLDNTLPTVFGVTNTGGAIHVTTASPVPLVVSGQTYNLTSNGSFSQLLNVVTPADAIGKGDAPLQVLQAEQSVRARVNLGIGEVTGNPATVEVTLFLPDSKVAPSTQIPLPANGFIQIPVIESFGLTNVYNARISLRVVDGTGKIGAYGSVIDMATQAPVGIPAQH